MKNVRGLDKYNEQRIWNRENITVPSLHFILYFLCDTNPFKKKKIAPNSVLFI